MRLSVLNLTRIDLATKEDKRYHLDYWASLFKATTWEELKMIAKQDDFINEASATVYQLSQEEMIRLQCEAREDFYRRQRSVQHTLDNQKDMLERQNLTIKNQSAAIKNKNTTIKKQNATIDNQNATINNQNVTIKQLTDEIASLREQLSDALKLK